MSSQDIAGLGARVKTQYQKAIEAGDAFFFSSDVSSFPDEKIGVDVRLMVAMGPSVCAHN